MKEKPKRSNRGLQPIGGLLTSSSDAAIATVASRLKARRLLAPLLPPSVQSHVRFLGIERDTLTILVDHPAWRTQIQPLEGLFRTTLAAPQLRFRYRVTRSTSREAQTQPFQPQAKDRSPPSTEATEESVVAKIARWKRSLTTLKARARR